MPLCESSKFGISYIAHPLYTQQLGVFGDSSAELIKSMVDSIPRKFKVIFIRFNSTNELSLIPHSERINTELIILDEENQLKNFNQNTRRNLKKFESSGLEIERSKNFEEFLDFKKKTSKADLSESDWKKSQNLLAAIQQKGYLDIHCVRMEGKLIAAVSFVHWNKRLYYLFAAANEEGKKSGASFGIVKNAINTYRGEIELIDFEGSQDENIRRFFLGFGAEIKPYFELKKWRLF